MKRVQYVTPSFQQKKKKSRFVICVMLLLALLFFALFQLEQRIWPVATKTIEYQCRSLAVTTIQKTCNQLLLKNAEQYDDLYEIQYNDAGKIESIVGNAAKINSLQDAIVDAVNTDLKVTEKMNVQIPIGTLTGIPVLNSLGPTVNVRVTPLSLANSQITSRFTDSGINQTKLEIFIHLEVDVAAMLAGRSNTIHVENDTCIAQIIIVGETPMLYSE